MPRTKLKTDLSDCADLNSHYGAGLLADHINAYWKNLGATVRAERYELVGSGGKWGVRSSLYNGLPRVADPLAARKREFLG